MTTNIANIEVKFYGLVHAYKKHGYGEYKVKKALSKPIIGITTDWRTGNRTIWNNEYEVIVIDSQDRLLTAYQGTLEQYLQKANMSGARQPTKKKSKRRR